MGHLPTPANGAAIDVNYISQIVTEINNLTTDLGNVGRQSRIINSASKTVPKLKIPTSQLSFVAGRKAVSSDANSATNDVINTTFFFGQNFKYPPLVVATPEINSSGIKNNTLGVSVVVKEVFENRVDLFVIFNSDAKKVTINVNVLAIGAAVSYEE
jgi:hypothetical protein